MVTYTKFNGCNFQCLHLFISQYNLEYHFITIGMNNSTMQRKGWENMRYTLLICCAWYRVSAHLPLLSAGSLAGEHHFLMWCIVTELKFH